MMSNVEIYTDGACSGNPGPGGWGVLILHNLKEKILSGANKNTTNNVMELTAVLIALKYIKNNIKQKVIIYTDSSYVVNGYNIWMTNWSQRGWKKSDGKQILNLELWQQIFQFRHYQHVQIIWIKGHNNNIYNEKVDQIAKSMIS